MSSKKWMEKGNKAMKGDRVKKILAVLLLMMGVSFSILVCQQIISWKDAHNYYGQRVTVEGIIVASYNSGRACFLNFHQDYKRYFSAVIFAADFSKFPQAPEDFYLNKTVRISGLIKEYQGKPEIVLENPSNIMVISEPKKQEEIIEISWEDADKYYGKQCCVSGKIVATFNSGKACFLNFHKNWKRYFTTIIFSADFAKFPPNPELYYKDKAVKITGVIREYQGKPEIIVKNPAQIQMIEQEPILN